MEREIKKRTTWTLKGLVILDNGKEMWESYGDINQGNDKTLINIVKNYLLPEWNDTSMGGYGKTLCVLDKINNETNEKTRIYRKSKPQILREIKRFGYLKN